MTYYGKPLSHLSASYRRVVWRNGGYENYKVLEDLNCFLDDLEAERAMEAGYEPDPWDYWYRWA